MTKAVESECLEEVVNLIRGAGIERFETDEIRPMDMPSDWSNIPRGVLIVTQAHVEAAGTVGRDDYGYKFLIAITFGTSKGASENQGDLSDIRSTIRNLFNNKRLTNVTTSMICGVAAGEMLQNQPWRDNQSVSVLQLTCWCRETRP